MNVQQQYYHAMQMLYVKTKLAVISVCAIKVKSLYNFPFSFKMFIKIYYLLFFTQG